MSTQKWQRTLEKIRTTKPELYKQLTGKDPQAEPKPQNREVVNNVDITNVPQNIREVIRSLDRDAKSGPDNDFVTMVKDVVRDKGCTVAEAVTEVNRACPQAQQQMIDAANKPTVDQMPRAYVGDLDPVDFKKIVRQYRRKYNCSYQQALKMIDQDHPGFRAEYIRLINK